MANNVQAKNEIMMQRKKIDNLRRCTLLIRLTAMLQMYYFVAKNPIPPQGGCCREKKHFKVKR